jgi:signal transduction histidine kinase
MNWAYLGLLYPMLMLNFAIAVGIVRYRRRQIANIRRLRERQLEDFEAYKKEVAGELHDHFGQVKMQFSKLLRERQGEVDADLASAIVDLEGQFSNINEVLYPAGVETGDVGMLFQRLVETAASPTTTMQYVGPSKLVTTPERALHIYRIVQETLSNALRHSRPNTLELRAEVGPKGRWAVTCEYVPTTDASPNGRAPGRGRGQTILASRLAILGATRDVAASDGRRTERFTIPAAP